MWHEARKQEKKIRGMLVDYRRRAERRQDFYERIKADPTQFMQVHGRKSKIHLDPAVAIAGDSATIMMPWQGQKDNIIDRFDARAHLDFIPPPPPPTNSGDPTTSDDLTLLTTEERQTNYERFRVLAQNEFLCISEEKFLHQLHLEEQFGVNAQQEADRVAAKKAQKSQAGGGAAIGYTYEDSTGDYPRASGGSSGGGFGNNRGNNNRAVSPTAAEDEEDSDSDLDVDVCITINKLSVTEGNELNKFGRGYGMLSNDFYSFLTRDADEADAMRLAREEEHEKVLLGGRKSRRERRAQREKKFIKRFQSPPSYATREEDFRDLVSGGGSGTNPGDAFDKKGGETQSRSPSPVNSGVITYITSFGGEDEALPGASSTAATLAKNQKNQTVSRLQQLKSQLTLGSIVTEKNRAVLMEDRAKGSSSRATDMARKTTTKAEIVGKPMLYRRSSRSPRRNNRSRSRSRTRRDRYRSDRSISSNSSNDRSRHRRDDRSRRRPDSRRRSVDRRRRSSSYSPQRHGRRRRSSGSSSRSRSSSSRSRSRSSSSSSTSSYARRRNDNRSNHRREEKRSKSPQKQMSRSRDCQKETQPVTKTTTTVDIKPIVEVVVAKPTVVQPTPLPLPPPPPPPTIISSPEVQVPIKKYYGRRKEDHSDSELSYSEDEHSESSKPVTKSSSNRDQQKTDSNSTTPSSGSRGSRVAASGSSASLPSLVKSAGGASEESKGATASSGNPRDRLKRKMQSLLNKQYKADKKAEHEKSERQMQVQQERDEEMRELAIKLRKRQRELRHRSDGTAYGQSSDEGDDQEAIDDFKSHAYASNATEDEEERQIQARLHKLVAMSRGGQEDEYDGGRHEDQAPQRSQNDRRDYEDYDSREKRSRRRDSSRERNAYASSHSSSSQNRRRRDSRDERRESPSDRFGRSSSRWDSQRRNSPPPPPSRPSASSGNSGGGGGRSRRLVDY